MYNNDKVEAVNYLSPNQIRLELDGKIEQKVSNTVFFSILAIVVTVIGAAFYYTNKVDDKTTSLAERIAKVETRLESRKH